MSHPLTQLRGGLDDRAPGGLFAVCSTHPLVLQRAIRLALLTDSILLVEATANQVNSAGGYSGLTPSAFAAWIGELGRQNGLPADRILVGADHLGPHAWKNLPITEAMHRAEQLTRECVQAGFCKLHFDTVTGQAIEFGSAAGMEKAARHAAALCRAAEETAGNRSPAKPLHYVVGTDVPPPGGGLEEDHNVTITRPDQLRQTIDLFEHTFKSADLHDAWHRVVAVVVQPGVEFGDREVAAYRRARARELSKDWCRLPGRMTFEVHATDYQRPGALRRLVRDHFNLIKVGPCLTFALREALYALSHIERALPDIDCRADLVDVMEAEMILEPRHWHDHYKGPPEELEFLRHYSLRDRIRYYWSRPRASQAVDQLLRNLRRTVPGALLHQFLPDLYPDPRTPTQPIEPHRIIGRRIDKVLLPYASACGRHAGRRALKGARQ
jgi:D-tagatose-1,6-bisphosphate aldolase subunit GatZ/KbaZ